MALASASGHRRYFPILPTLLQDLTGTTEVAPYIGVLTAIYAVMQFFFAPVLGALSDRLGRHSVLLVLLAGAAADYLYLARPAFVDAGCWARPCRADRRHK